MHSAGLYSIVWRRENAFPTIGKKIGKFKTRVFFNYCTSQLAEVIYNRTRGDSLHNSRRPFLYNIMPLGKLKKKKGTNFFEYNPKYARTNVIGPYQFSEVFVRITAPIPATGSRFGVHVYLGEGRRLSAGQQQSSEFYFFLSKHISSPS